ncbi:hypothetical protein [Nitrosomonas sp.]|nr:hypothetical protein [Nitrosomonas sp.]
MFISAALAALAALGASSLPDHRGVLAIPLVFRPKRVRCNAVIRL